MFYFEADQSLKNFDLFENKTSDFLIAVCAMFGIGSGTQIYVCSLTIMSDTAKAELS